MIEQLKFNADGLICAIAVDADNGAVLMQAWMNLEAIKVSIAENHVCYYSRSRKKLWRKGEQSGNRQKLREIRVDCDNDCLLLLVEQQGAACHTGTKSCFYRKLDGDNLVTIAEPIQDAAQLYNNI
ncbi:MAG: phosphoribosyl-AMP cyclohydrolase [Alphaproteobacteria bacterium]|nr:phosphoribosyl-AMP cyclohydrolase [Alphaproteobacteria bacterium]